MGFEYFLLGVVLKEQLIPLMTVNSPGYIKYILLVPGSGGQDVKSHSYII